VRPALIAAKELQDFLLGTGGGGEDRLQVWHVEGWVACLLPEPVEDDEEGALVWDAALVTVDDVADHVRVGAMRLHGAPQPVDAAYDAVLVTLLADRFADVL